jgi:hypothetical protein
MWYGDKQEARVKIAMALVQKGWEIYGFKNDESDAMIDYFSPADWDGIAEKNGFVLCIDQNNLRYSGYEQKEYIGGNAVYKTNDRIKKLEAMMNDAASSENEKASCAVLIEKEKEKVGAIEKYKVVETYPKFSFANPRGTSWHIEKDGQIIAKGKGVFAVNDYDWENKEKTEKQQKAEKVEALINRFEKVIKNTDALQAEVIQVPVTVTKEIEKTVTEVTESDIKDGFTFIMKVGYTHGKYKGNKYTFSYKGEHYNAFAQLTKNNKPSTSIGKSWSLTLDRINELLKKEHIAVIEFIEVTEYKEKTVYRKTARKQTVSNVPAIETTGEAQETVSNNTEENEVEEPATTRQLWALHCATKLDTRGMKISKTKASELITKSKAGHNVILEVKAYMNTNETITPDKENGLAEKEGRATDSTLNNDDDKRRILQEESASKNINQQQYISKINKQLESATKKLNALSGDYQTNTWKRQQEAASREQKKENLKLEISILEYLKEKTTNNTMDEFDIALLVGSFREDMRIKYKSRGKYNYEVKYPTINPDADVNGWWNQEVPKLQKRLNKAGIHNTEQYHDAIDKYGALVKTIEKPVNPVQQKINKMESEVKLYKIDGYFPTPKTIVQRMIDLADIQDGETILEPSAGNGNILDGVNDYIQDNNLNAEIHGIEWNYTLREILELKQYKLVANDFIEFVPFTKYEKIIMNPPFEKGKDVDHVLKAYDCLKDGGRLIAIMSPHWTFASDTTSVQFRNWLNDKGYYEKLPEGSFKESGTGVNTVLVVIEKSKEETARAN